MAANPTKVTLYTSHITPDKNAIVTYKDGKFMSPHKNYSDFISYTSVNGTVTYTISNFNYVKHAKNIEVKFAMDESRLLSTDNYCIIQNNSGMSNTSSFYERPICYFIVDKKWTASNTVTCTLQMDTLNTFADLFDNNTFFSAASKIERAHKDRFLNSCTQSVYDANMVFYLTRKVDEVSEGLPKPVLQLATNPTDVYKLPSMSTKKSGENSKWLLVYMQDPGTTGTNPQIGIAAIPKHAADFVKTDNSSVTLSSGLSIRRDSNQIYQILEIPYPPFNDTHYTSDKYYWSDAYVLDDDHARWSYKSIGGGDSGITSCLWLDATQWANIGYVKSTLKGDILDKMDVMIPGASSRKSTLKNASYESKLYHSDFYSLKYIFDSYTVNVRPEALQASGYAEKQTDQYTNPTYQSVINYYQSIQGNSSLMFEFSPRSTMTGVSVFYKKISDYEQYLVSQRDLRSPLVNSALASYLRTGYYYDQKSVDMQNQHDAENTIYSAINTTFGAVGSVGNTITAGGKGNVMGTVTGGLGTVSKVMSVYKSAEDRVYAENMRENSLRSKMAGIESQGMSIRNNNDLGLFDVYGHGGLQKAEYEPTSQMKTVLANYFHETGYYSPETTNPNDYFNTRRSFNFVKFKPIISDNNLIKLSIFADDLKEKCDLGITIYHVFNNGTSDVVDWTKVYENWELWLCPR